MKETKERLPFHMVITDNRTGEVVYELDARVIVGAAQTENDDTACIVLAARYGALDVAATILGAQKSQTGLLNKHPEVLPLLMGMSAANDEDEE